MDLKEYQKICLKTAAKYSNKDLEIATWGLGISGEAGDVASCIKKYYAHKDKKVKDGIKENIGDTLWYMAMVCNFFGWQLEEVLEENYQKLATRYPKGFTYKGAQRKMIKWSGQKEIKKLKAKKQNHGK